MISTLGLNSVSTPWLTIWGLLHIPGTSFQEEDNYYDEIIFLKQETKQNNTHPSLSLPLDTEWRLYMEPLFLYKRYFLKQL